jgi:hypothetical protein
MKPGLEAAESLQAQAIVARLFVRMAQKTDRACTASAICQSFNRFPGNAVGWLVTLRGI